MEPGGSEVQDELGLKCDGTPTISYSGAEAAGSHEPRILRLVGPT